MKKSINKPEEQDEMQPEYNFADKKGVRGKYHEAYRQGHSVKVYEENGTVSIQYFTLEDGAVMLEPDVRVYFPTSESVNQALRTLIATRTSTLKGSESQSSQKASDI